MYQDNAIILADQRLGPGQPPFIIAEMSGNHRQSLERALAIVTAAANSGVNALKLQTYTAETMTLDLDQGEFRITDPDSLWNGRSLYDLYNEAHTPWHWHEPIFKHCREQGLFCFSTPFDRTAVDFLEDLNCPCYKIASFENNDLPLLQKVASTGKPVILSTGMATLAQLAEAVQTLRQHGCQELILLKCTSTYPAPPEQSHLLTIPHMRDLFSCQVGLSDHTTGIGTAVAAVALGATVIEKHFTLDRSDGGVDSAFSLDPEEMALLVDAAHQAWRSLGRVHYGPTSPEKASRQFRRSIYASRDIEAGDMLSPENIRIIRPGFGLEPRYYPMVLGMRATRTIARGTAIRWSFLQEAGHSEDN